MIAALGQRDLFEDGGAGAPRPYVCDPCRDAWFGLPLDRKWFQYVRFGAAAGRSGWVWCDATYRKVLRCRPSVSVVEPGPDGRIWFEDTRPTFRSRAAHAVWLLEREYHTATARIARAEAVLTDVVMMHAGHLMHPIEHCGFRGDHAACHEAIRARVEVFAEGGVVQPLQPCLLMQSDRGPNATA